MISDIVHHNVSARSHGMTRLSASSMAEVAQPSTVATAARKEKRHVMRPPHSPRSGQVGIVAATSNLAALIARSAHPGDTYYTCGAHFAIQGTPTVRVHPCARLHCRLGIMTSVLIIIRSPVNGKRGVISYKAYSRM